MVLQRPHEYVGAYKTLRQVYTDTGNPILIFCAATDCDSLCALRILTNLFRLEDPRVRYSVLPVSGYHDLEKYRDKLADRERRGIVFLNCGALADIRQFVDVADSVTVIVDAHRPFDHHNLRYDNVYLFADDEEVEQLADLPLDLDSDSDIGSESDDDEDEDRPSQRRRLEEDEGGDARRAKIQKRRRMVQHYSEGSFFGDPCGCSLYRIATDLRRDTIDLLWLSIVSLTDQYVHQRISQPRYEGHVLDKESSVRVKGNADIEHTITIEDGAGEATVPVPETDSIQVEEELNLMLLRHWSLYESLMHSPYIASKLNTWSDNGKSNLDLLLAKMGMPLTECRQSFSMMKAGLKRRLQSLLLDHGEAYGLSEDLTFKSFKRFIGYRVPLSATDVVYGITALLEEGVGGADWGEKFWQAVDALSPSASKDLEHGIQLSMRLQRSLIREAHAALSRKGDVSSRKYQVVDLTTTSVDVSLIARPLALSRLAQFLLDAKRELSHSNKKIKPLIAAVPSRSEGRVLLVGVSGRPGIGERKGSKFGLAFSRTAQEMQDAETKHNGFDTDVIEVGKENLHHFLGLLRANFD